MLTCRSSEAGPPSPAGPEGYGGLLPHPAPPSCSVECHRASRGRHVAAVSFQASPWPSSHAWRRRSSVRIHFPLRSFLLLLLCSSSSPTESAAVHRRQNSWPTASRSSAKVSIASAVVVFITGCKQSKPAASSTSPSSSSPRRSRRTIPSNPPPLNHPSLRHHLDCVQGELARDSPLFPPSFAHPMRIRHGCRSMSPPWTTMRSPLCPFIASSARAWLLSTVAFERMCFRSDPCTLASTTTSSPYCLRRHSSPMTLR